MTKEKILKTAKDKRIGFVRLWFTDVLGFLKSFDIPIEELPGALKDGMGFDGSSIEGFSRIEESDMVVKPDPGTFQILPWIKETKPVARMFCDVLETSGKPFTGDPRYVLKRNLAEAKKMGFSDEAVRDNLQKGCGETGAAHPLVMLVKAMQDARPGQKILVIGFGQGADALLFQTTDKIKTLPPRNGIKGALANGRIEKNYQKFLSFNNRVDVHWGIRAESVTKTRLTAAYRDRKMLMSLTGGKCKACGTVQFPAGHICVNPDCRAIDSHEDYPLADSTANIASYTVDWLAYTPNPPMIFGMVEFEEGAKFMMEMTGFDPNEVEVGTPVKMVFRIKDYDKVHNFPTYFWKAAPKEKSK